MLEVTKNKTFETQKIMDYEAEQSLQITNDLIGENSVSWGELYEMNNMTGAELLAELEKIPVDEKTGTIKTNFYAFEKGTEKEAIYGWFDWVFETVA